MHLIATTSSIWGVLKNTLGIGALGFSLVLVSACTRVPDSQVSAEAPQSTSASLTITTAGAGAVTSTAPAGIDCGSICSLTAPIGTDVTLIAAPDHSHALSAWSGACSGSGVTCTFRLTANSTVHATFNPSASSVSLTVQITGTGIGSVTCNGSPCPGQGTYPWGTVVLLTAISTGGSTFTGWNGVCAGQSGTTCTVTLRADVTAIATFSPLPNARLTIDKAGSGSGTVTSAPLGIDCGSTCSTSFLSGTSVTVTAVAANGSSFTGWSGTAVTCPGTSPCLVLLNGDTSITATFVPASTTYNLTVSGGSGTGTVQCNGGNCNLTYAGGTALTLTAAPGAGFIFESWAGACAGQGNPCSVTMSEDRTVTANFRKPALTVVLLSAGTSGSVASSPAGINCGTICLALFDAGSAVTLTATVPAGTVLTGWNGGGCSGTGTTCTVNLSGDTTVSALFGTNSAYVYPLSLGPTSRYLVDRNGKPYLLVGDTAWSLLVAINDQDVDFYLEDRRQRGFTMVFVELIERYFGPNAPNNIYGDAPFTGKVFTTPNEAYFSHVDYAIRSAAAKGIVVMLTPLYLGQRCGTEGWCAEVQAASLADMTAWGRYVGRRYKDYDNIVWAIGGDTDPTPVQSKVQAMVDGILLEDTRHPFTAHNAPNQITAVAPWPGASWLNVNNVYTYSLTLYESVLDAYNTVPAKPVFLVESAYENDEFLALNQQLRAQSYWTLLSGGFGHMFGNCPLWGFSSTRGFCVDTDWRGWLDSEGSVSMTHFQALFHSRHWHLLAPTNSVITAGAGTFGGQDYATAASASDGSSIVVYLPSGRTLGVTGSSLAGPTMTAWWYNPRTGVPTRIGGTGATYPTSSPQSFTPPGGEDWVLVLDSINFSFPPPGS